MRRAADTSRAHGEALQTRTSAQASLEKVQQDMAVGQLRVGYLLDFEEKLKQQQVAMNEELRVTSVALARLAPALSAGSDSGAAAVGPRMHHAEVTYLCSVLTCQRSLSCIDEAAKEGSSM